MVKRPRDGTAPPKLRLIEAAEPDEPDEPDDHALVAGLEEAAPWARALLFDRYAGLVERTIRRVLGREWHVDMADLVHDCFVEVLGSLHRLRDPQALPAWMRSIAARTACRAIRRRRARRWLLFWDADAVPPIVVSDAAPEIRQACARTYALLERFSGADRVAFVLRHVEGLDLAAVAEASGVSLATIKRRLARAERRFALAAASDPVLCLWVREGGRWTR